MDTMNKKKKTLKTKVIKVDNIQPVKETNDNLDFDEGFNPDVNDADCWINTDTTKMMRYDPKTLPNIEIKDIDEKYKLVQSQTQLQTNTIIPQDNAQTIWIVYKIYKICDDDGNKHIAYTRDTIGNILRNELLKLKQGNNSKLDIFKDRLKQVKYKLLDCYKGLGNCTKELNKIKTQYSTPQIKDTIVNSDNDNDNSYITFNDKSIWNVYLDYYKNELTENEKKKLTKKKYYIYKIFKSQEENIQYIVGLRSLITKQTLERLMKENNINLGTGTKSYVLLEEGDCYLDCEMLLRTDKYINDLDTIANGENFCFNVINPNYIGLTKVCKKQIHRDMFMDVQYSIMMTLYEDIDIKKSYIACVKSNDNKKFVFTDNNMSPHCNLQCFYMRRDECHISDFFGSQRFVDYQIIVLHENINQIHADIKYLFYKKQLQTWKPIHETTQVSNTKQIAKKPFIPKMFYAKTKKKT